jgi:GT2 family glycosyltransferase
MKRYPISIVIPVYKNYAMFYKYLRANKKYFEGCEVIVMNDYPRENITRPVKRIYPGAVIVNNKKNFGFAGNVNRGTMRAKRNYIFLMNSDVVLKDDSFTQTISLFKKNPKLFAVGLSQLEKGGKIVGANRGYFKNGFVHHSSRPARAGSNFWAEGGASIFRKSLLQKLGLFDPLFNPFYWEDIDLSYRAWKAGYTIAFAPHIVVEHHHESTIGKYFNRSKITRTAFRNQLIFHWKNLTDQDLLIQHLTRLPMYLLTPGFFDALLQLPRILKSRKQAVKLFIKSDKAIL